MSSSSNLELAIWAVDDYDSEDHERMCMEMAECIDEWSKTDDYLDRDWSTVGFRQEMRSIFKKYGYFSGEKCLDHVVEALEGFIGDELYY